MVVLSRDTKNLYQSVWHGHQWTTLKVQVVQEISQVCTKQNFIGVQVFGVFVGVTWTAVDNDEMCLWFGRPLKGIHSDVDTFCEY